MTTDEDPPPADAAAALRLIVEQRTEAGHKLHADPRLYFWPWGVAWLLGFGLFFLRFSPGGRTLVDMPGWLPLTTLFVLLAGAGVVSGLAGAKAYGQISGDSSRRNAWYGWAWLLGFASYAVATGRVAGSLPEELAGLLWAAGAVGLTGVLHLAGGAIWLDRNLLTLGAWITVSNIVGVVAGPGWHALVVAVAGGGGMLLAGTVVRLRQRGQRRPPGAGVGAGA
jgi:hypothetical protein